jgi:oligoribonuclease NrnB/cAMP/cGMP phosphodiesterase (DHH superfamily)
MEPEQMRQLAAFGKMGLTYIDHHISSIEKFYDDIAVNGSYKIGTVFSKENEKIAACELTWKHCFGNSPLPLYIELIGATDANRQDEDRYPLKIREYMLLGLEHTHHFVSPQTCLPWVLEKLEDTISMTHRHMRQLEKELYEHAQICSFESILHGYKAICLETKLFHPKAFTGVFLEDKHDIMVAFKQLPDSYRVSVYSLREDINVADIAKQFGGGGHAYAAGFQVKDIDKII